MAGLVFGALEQNFDRNTGKVKQAFWTKFQSLLSAVQAVSNNGFVTHAPFAKVALPSAVKAGAGAAVLVTDASGGAQPAWSDGTIWRYASGAAV